MPNRSITILSFHILLLLSACKASQQKEQSEDLLKNEGIHAAFYNSTGTRIAMATTKGRLLLCDHHLKILKAVQAHKGVANSSFFSLNDAYIITGGADQKIKQWHANSLQLARTFPYAFNSHTTVLGTNSMVGCGENGRLLIHDIRTQKAKILRVSPTAAYHVYYNQKDTSVVVSAGRAAVEVALRQQKITRTYDSRQELVFCVMPDQTNQTVVLACADSTIKVFERKTQQLLYQSKKLDGQVYVACYNYHNDVIAASTSAGSIYFFDTQLKTSKKRIKAFEGCINTIHYDPTDNFLVAGSLDPKNGGVKLYKTNTYSLIKALR